MQGKQKILHVVPYSECFNLKQIQNNQATVVRYQVPELSLLLPDRRHPETEMHELPNNIYGSDSDGSAHKLPLIECPFEEPKLHSEAGSTHSSEIEREIIRINEEYDKCDEVYKSQRIDQEASIHMGRRYIRDHGRFMQPYNVRNDVAKHLLTESMHSVCPAHPNIPLDARAEAIKLCSTEVLVSKSSAGSLSETEMNENRSSKTNHSSANFKDKETCQKGFTKLVETRFSEVSPMTRSGKCQWQYFGPDGVNPDPIPLSSETDGIALCDVHNFVSPNISVTAAGSHSFFPPKTNSEGSSLNSNELNLRLKGINQESDGCSSS